MFVGSFISLEASSRVSSRGEVFNLSLLYVKTVESDSGTKETIICVGQAADGARHFDEMPFTNHENKQLHESRSTRDESALADCLMKSHKTNQICENWVD